MTTGAVAGQRVLLLTSHPLDGRDGADKELAHALVHGMPSTRFTSFRRVGSRDAGGRVAGRRLPMASVHGMPGPLERAQALALGLLEERRVDLVHAVLTIGPGFPRLVDVRRRVNAGRLRPCVHTVPAVADPRALASGRPLGTTVALSAVTRDQLLDAGFPDVRLIPAGIDLERWPFRPRPSADVPVVGFAGHYDPGGGAEEALQVLSRVAARGIPLRAAFYMRVRLGQDPVPLARRLADRARSLGVADVAVHGATPDMPRAVAALDVLLHPARALGGKADVPLTVLESMASGRPVVISDLPQMRAVHDGALVVPAGDADAGAAALEQLLTEPRSYAAAAARARALVERSFATGTMVQRYTALYEELLDGPGTR